MGGSGGGGSAGEVDFPEYMKDAHTFWLANANIGTSISDVMDAALSASPFLAITAYDPDTELDAMLAKAGVFETAVTGFSGATGLDTLAEEIISDTRINADIDAFSDLLDDQNDSTVLPRFRAGMRDINAVMSSAFVIGEALIEEGRNHEVAKYTSALRLKAFSEDALRVIGMKLQYQQSVAMMYADMYRIKIIAKAEEIEENNAFAEADARWPFEVFLYGGQMLGIIGGGTFVPKGKSKAMSKLGGTMAGAAAGAYVGGSATGGNPYGYAAGAVIGGVAGYLSS